MRVAAEKGGRLRGVLQDIQLHVFTFISVATDRIAEPSQGPASIFHRKMEDQSDYLHAKGHTIQKAFGQTK